MTCENPVRPDGSGDPVDAGSRETHDEGSANTPAGTSGAQGETDPAASDGGGPTDGNPLRRLLLVLALATVVGVVVALVSDVPVRILGGFHGGGGIGHGPGMGPGGAIGTPFEPLVLVKVFLATFNLVVLLALGWSYLSLYRDLPNRFTGSLLLVTGALFLYALASNPVISLAFGYRGDIGLGPFTFLPDLFAAVAVTVLLYQSYQ
ncbi:MAG: hypothetical protein V5A43_04060 [Haloarculaceae archaeon]